MSRANTHPRTSVFLALLVTALATGCGKDFSANRQPREQSVDLGNGIRMTLVWCPPTTSDEWKTISGGKEYFLMGSPTGELGRQEDETRHPVVLTSGFWITKFEVTSEQWTMVTDGSIGFTGTGPHFPAVQQNWDRCQEFIGKLNAIVPGGGFRLPTEAEWEYACRAGTVSALNNGKDLTSKEGKCPNMEAVAKFFGSTPRTKRSAEEFVTVVTCEIASWGARVASSSRVRRDQAVARVRGTSKGPEADFPIVPDKGGERKPNAWGICDMHGNVSEWCTDWYGQYPTNLVTNPTGPKTGSMRVVRGGAWDTYGRACRSACRSKKKPSLPNVEYYTTGLRLVRDAHAAGQDAEQEN